MKKVKKKPRKFFKSIITVTVLSEDSPVSMTMELADIDYAITHGDLVGEVALGRITKLSRKAVVEELEMMNSVPEFFGLDRRGRDLP